MLRIKKEIDLKELEKFGFRYNEFYPNYVYETRSKNGNYVFVEIHRKTRVVEGFSHDVSLNSKQIRHFCPAIFKAGYVEKVEEE